MPSDKIEPTVQPTTKELTQFVEAISHEYLSVQEYSPDLDTPELRAEMNEIELAQYDYDKEMFLQDEQYFKAIERCLEFRVPRLTDNLFCVVCKFPFSVQEKRGVLYCSSCGQLLRRPMQ